MKYFEFILTMTIGYSAFSTELNLGLTAIVRVEKEIRITDMSLSSSSSDAISHGASH